VTTDPYDVPRSASPPLLRRMIGAVLRRIRLRQGRTLRDVARAADVSIPYLSELERGRKEASSEVLASICRALGLHLADLLDEVRDELLSRLTPEGPGRVAPRRRRPRPPIDRLVRHSPRCRAGTPATRRTLRFRCERISPQQNPTLESAFGREASQAGFLGE
jgi:transcriptional regulator with XRE-family HTH domain